MNPQPKLYHLIDIEGEKKLREVGNPYQMNADLCELELYHDWNRTTTANAKTLINPVNGKSEYLETELRKVYRYFTEGEWRIFKRNHSHSDYFDDGYNTQEAFEYIGEKVEEIEISEIQQVKNDNYLLTIKVDQLERELVYAKQQEVIDKMYTEADMLAMGEHVRQAAIQDARLETVCKDHACGGCKGECVMPVTRIYAPSIQNINIPQILKTINDGK